MKKNVLLVVFAAILVAGCASDKSKQQSSQGGAPDAASAAAAGADGQNGAAGPLSKRSVYYPLDIAEVQPSEKPTIEAHAHYLAAHPDQQVRLEGNCDERGSSEYNLALGQRRADGVRKLMVADGAGAKQIATASLGKEKPRMTCHEETCWQENRRTDFVYPK